MGKRLQVSEPILIFNAERWGLAPRLPANAQGLRGEGSKSGSMGLQGVIAPMRTVFALGLAVSVAAFGAGCSSARITQPLPIGADTYTVSARTPHGGTASARDAALSAANQQCARLSKQLLVLKSSNNFELNENKDIESDIIDVTFRCLAAGDPALHRPN